MKRPRFEVVRTDAGWHARFVAANGRIVWTTEVYERERAARRAIAIIGDGQQEVVEFRYVDERSTDLCSCGHPRSFHHSRVGCSVYTETNGFCGCVEGT